VKRMKKRNRGIWRWKERDFRVCVCVCVCVYLCGGKSKGEKTEIEHVNLYTKGNKIKAVNMCVCVCVCV
jgi:hypothetical protein